MTIPSTLREMKQGPREQGLCRNRTPRSKPFWMARAEGEPARSGLGGRRPFSWIGDHDRVVDVVLEIAVRRSAPCQTPSCRSGAETDHFDACVSAARLASLLNLSRDHRRSCIASSRIGLACRCRPSPSGRSRDWEVEPPRQPRLVRSNPNVTCVFSNACSTRPRHRKPRALASQVKAACAIFASKITKISLIKVLEASDTSVKNAKASVSIQRTSLRSTPRLCLKTRSHQSGSSARSQTLFKPNTTSPNQTTWTLATQIVASDGTRGRFDTAARARLEGATPSSS